MRVKKNLFAACVTLSLVACGGGSSDDSPVTPPPSTGDGGTPTPQEHIVNASYYSKCGVTTAHEDAVVIRHDSDGNAVDVYRADTNGDIVIDFNEVATFSLLYVSYDGERAYPSINTFVSVTPDKISDVSIREVNYDAALGCECSNVTLDVSGYANLYGGVNVFASALNESYASGALAVYDYFDTEVCRVTGGEWPEIAITMSAIDDEFSNDTYTSVVSDYDVDSPYVVANAHLNRNLPVSIQDGNPEAYGNIQLRSTGFSNGELHYLSLQYADYVEYLPTVAPIYDEESNIETRISADKFISEYTYIDNEEVLVNIITGAEQTLSSDHTATLDLPFMDLSIFAESLQQLFSEGSYNLSSSEADNVYIFYNGSNDLGEIMYSFSLTSPPEGSLDIFDSLSFDGVSLPFDIEFGLDEEPASGTVAIEIYNVLSTNDYLESINSKALTSFGIVYTHY